MSHARFVNSLVLGQADQLCIEPRRGRRRAAAVTRGGALPRRAIVTARRHAARFARCARRPNPHFGRDTRPRPVLRGQALALKRNTLQFGRRRTIAERAGR